MRAAPYLLLTLGLAVACATCGFRSGSAAPVPSRAEPGKPYGVGLPSGFPARFGASTSCSASACHGNAAIGERGGEQSTWASEGTQHDPHRKAFGVLFNEVSINMVTRMGWKTAAHETSLCLKCHAVNEEKWYDGDPLGDKLHSEGVSCEACHGPSKLWLSAHYEPGWKSLSNRDKWQHYGFTPTKNLVTRASMCAACHVGSADREVNHDLIAAGHPRLNFEYTRFHYAKQYQHHWREATPQPDFELRAWYIGQLASLRAAVGLLETRAQQAQKKEHPAPWPEFAESSCFACHQQIGRSDLRSLEAQSPRSSGVLPWQPWYTALVEMLPKMSPVLLPDDGLSAMGNFNELRQSMQQARPNSETVCRQAKEAGSALDAWLARIQDIEARGSFSPLSTASAVAVGRMLTRNALDADANSLRDHDWDFVAQHYLGLMAAYHAAGGSTPGSPVAGWKPSLDSLRTALAFPHDGRRANSPVEYRPAAAFAQLRTLYSLTATTETSR